MTSLALPLRHTQFPSPSVARPATLMHARLLRENRVLDALPDSVWERIGPALSLVSLPAGKELQGSGVSLDAHPVTASTAGCAFSTTPFFAPRQPVTITRPFSASASPMASRDSSTAASMKPQVLTMTRSAPA